MVTTRFVAFVHSLCVSRSVGVGMNRDIVIGNTFAPFVSVAEAAAYLGVHPALVYREIQKGNLRAVKIGAKVIRVSSDDLGAYIQAQHSKAIN